MKDYIVRLRNYEGNVVDGEIYKAESENQAKQKYIARCERLGIAIGKFDYITVEDFPFN